MNKGNRGQRNSRGNKQILKTVDEKGITQFTDANKIPQSLWESHHGKTAAGNQVHSLQTIVIGESVLIRTNAGRAISVLQDELEVCAKQFLQEKGYQIQAPNSNK